MKVLKSKLAAALCLTLCLSSFLAFSTTPVDAQITSSTVTQTQLNSEPEAGRYGRVAGRAALAGVVFGVVTALADAAVSYLAGAENQATSYPSDALDNQ